MCETRTYDRLNLEIRPHLTEIGNRNSGDEQAEKIHSSLELRVVHLVVRLDSREVRLTQSQHQTICYDAQNIVRTCGRDLFPGDCGCKLINSEDLTDFKLVTVIVQMAVTFIVRSF